MIFERFEVRGLAHFSYILGCEVAKEIVVVDPKRDVDTYIEFAKARGLKIIATFDTHIHADYASGARELATQTGCQLLLSGHDKDEMFQIQFPHQDIFDGNVIEVGSIQIKVLHTPGHTPEHLSFLVFDPQNSKTEPKMMLSGDFLFVGALGRPDLLGEEAKRDLAQQLFNSVRQKLVGLPDRMLVYPGHGAGSMCGAGMGSEVSTTLGAERLSNPYLDKKLTQEEFVTKILGNVPPFPDYYRRMKKLNSEGPALLSTLAQPQALSPKAFADRLRLSAIAIDLRDYHKFGEGHVPGSLGIGAGAGFLTWAPWAVPYDTEILLVSPDANTLEECTKALRRVGLDSVYGYLDGGIQAWQAAGNAVTHLEQIEVLQLQTELSQGESIKILDVRSDHEFESGHIEGATHIMCGWLQKSLDKIPLKNETIGIVCGGGYRSTIAASILERAGHKNLKNVVGGMSAWREASLPVKVGN